MSQSMSVEEVKQHVRTYLVVFGALLFLTVATVGVSYLHLPVGFAVLVGLSIATLKAGLVALFFMHLSHEKKIIYATLELTAFFFVMLLAIAWFL